MLLRTLKTVPVVLLVLVVSTLQVRPASGQDCPGLGIPNQELCINIREDPRYTGGTPGLVLDFIGPSPQYIVQNMGSYSVSLAVELVDVPAGLAVTVEGTVERTGTDDTRINMTAQGGLHEGATLGGGSLRLVGSATGASVTQLGAAAGYVIGFGDPLYTHFPAMCGETLFGAGEFDCIENEQPLEEGSVALQIILSVDITSVGDIVDIPAGVGAGDINPGGIDEECLEVPTSFVPLCKEIQGVASTGTPVDYGGDMAAESLFFQVKESGPVEITIVPQGAPLFGALFMTARSEGGGELCSEFVDSPLYPDGGATETFTPDGPGTYYIVIHRETAGSDVPFSFLLESNECFITTTSTSIEFSTTTTTTDGEASTTSSAGTDTTTTTGDGTTTTSTGESSTTVTCITGDLCCMIETYGEDSEEIETLRYIRDNILKQTPEGQEIIRLYYEWSPTIARMMKTDEVFKKDVKDLVDGMMGLIGEVE